MNSPLVPQGSLLEQKNKGRARVRLAVFLVLAIHGIGLLALLMQGCKKEDTTLQSGADTNATATAFVPPANAPPPDTNVTTPPLTSPTTVETPAPSTTPAPGAAPTEYKIASGDTLSSVAKKFHVSLKALMDANPGIDPTKLQINQTIHIPPAPAPAPSTSTTSTTATETNGSHIYSVVSGDTLTKIAAQFKVTVKGLRQANNLTTDSLKVGQKLKIPPSPTTAPSAPAAPGGTSAPPASAPGQ